MVDIIIPVNTVSALCALTIFGLNLEARHVLLVSKRETIGEWEDYIGYALNPVIDDDDANCRQNALRMILHIGKMQRDYFKWFDEKHGKSLDENFRKLFTSGTEIESIAKLQIRYLALCKQDGLQPYNLENMCWDNAFNVEDSCQETLNSVLKRVRVCEKSLQETNRFLVKHNDASFTPFKELAHQLKAYLSHLGQAAYLTAQSLQILNAQTAINQQVKKAIGHLQRLTIDLLKNELFSLTHWLNKDSREREKLLAPDMLTNLLTPRAYDHVSLRKNANHEWEIIGDSFDEHYDRYRNAVEKLRAVAKIPHI